MRPLVLLLLVATAACMPPRSLHVTVPAPRLGAPVTPRAPVVLCRTLDLRPHALKQAHEPMQSGGFGLVLTGLFLGWSRTEGAIVYGDEKTTLTVNRMALRPVAALDAWLAAMLSEGTGQPLTLGCPRVSPGNVDGAAAAAGGRDALVIVPLLDQLDVVQLRSESGWVGSSESRSGNTVTTTSGSSFSSGTVGPYSNLRLRLVVLSVRGGAVVDRAVIYGAGASPSMPATFEACAAQLWRGLRAMLAA